MNKRSPFRYRNWKLSGQMDYGELVKLTTWKFLSKKNNPELRNSEFLMKINFPSYLTRELSFIKER